MTELATEPIISDTSAFSDLELSQTPQNGDQTVTAFYAAITTVLERDPTVVWTPKAMASEVHAKPNRVTKVFQRATSSKSKIKIIPVVKVGYGLYQYEASNEILLDQMSERYGKLGVENLVYCKNAGSGRLEDTLPNNVCSEQDKSQSTPKPGYPKIFKTGQEIRWEIWHNGTQRVSFISNGRPFSIDWLIDLHDQMIADGLTGNLWQRLSIEYNVDTLNVTIKPEYVDVQMTKAMLLKTYCHGQQMRKEVADRRPASLQNTLEGLLINSDSSAGRDALEEIKDLKILVNQIAGETRLARNIARKARDKVDEFVASNKTA
jgi:hypothetical protein